MLVPDNTTVPSVDKIARSLPKKDWVGPDPYKLAEMLREALTPIRVPEEDILAHFVTPADLPVLNGLLEPTKKLLRNVVKALVAYKQEVSVIADSLAASDRADVNVILSAAMDAIGSNNPIVALPLANAVRTLIETDFVRKDQRGQRDTFYPASVIVRTVVAYCRKHGMPVASTWVSPDQARPGDGVTTPKSETAELACAAFAACGYAPNNASVRYHLDEILRPRAPRRRKRAP